jgi:hypothetical protein
MNLTLGRTGRRRAIRSVRGSAGATSSVCQLREHGRTISRLGESYDTAERPRTGWPVGGGCEKRDHGVCNRRGEPW